MSVSASNYIVKINPNFSSTCLFMKFNRESTQQDLLKTLYQRIFQYLSSDVTNFYYYNRYSMNDFTLNLLRLSITRMHFHPI